MRSLSGVIARMRSRLVGRRAFLEWLAVGFGASVVVLWLALGAAADGPGRLVYDAFVRMTPRHPPQEVAVVAIDNRSLEAVGAWPWPREVHAELIDRLAEAEPAAIGYDVLFLEPSPQADATLARAMTAADAIHLPRLVEAPGEDGAPWRVLDPVPELASAARGIGHVALTPDGDGAVRAAPLFLGADGRLWPHLAVGVLEQAGHPTAWPAEVPRAPALQALEPVMIAYGGPTGHMRTVSAIDLLNGEVPRQALTGRVVFVGVTADGAGDRYSTPYAQDGALTPGVEVIAALADTLISGQGRRTPPRALLAGVSLIPLWLLMAAFLLFRPRTNMLLGLGLVAGMFGLSAAAFAEGVWASPLAAVGGLALAWPLWSWRRLEAAVSYLETEVEAFEREAPRLTQGSQAVPGAGPGLGPGDVIERQVNALQTALGGLRTAERQREQALQLLGHDMRAPQVSILTLLEGEHDRNQPAFIDRIAGYARRTLHLAEAYVQQARAEAPVGSDEFVDLAQIVGQAADSLWPQARAREIRIEEPALEGEALTRGDPALLMRAFVNLLDNAIKFARPDGRVTCVIAAAGDADRAVWRCSVRDDGEGVPEAALADLSKPFHRASGDAPGVGLGLTFVRTVATRYGGRLECANAPEGGAVFTLVLPAADGPSG